MGIDGTGNPHTSGGSSHNLSTRNPTRSFIICNRIWAVGSDTCGIHLDGVHVVQVFIKGAFSTLQNDERLTQEAASECVCVGVACGGWKNLCVCLE